MLQLNNFPILRLSLFLEHEIPGASSLRFLYADQRQIIITVWGFFIAYLNFKDKAHFLPRHAVEIRAVF